MRHLVSFNIHDEAYTSLVREVHYLSAIDELSSDLKDNVFSTREKEKDSPKLETRARISAWHFYLTQLLEILARQIDSKRNTGNSGKNRKTQRQMMCSALISQASPSNKHLRIQRVLEAQSAENRR